MTFRQWLTYWRYRLLWKLGLRKEPVLCQHMWRSSYYVAAICNLPNGHKGDHIPTRVGFGGDQ